MEHKGLHIAKLRLLGFFLVLLLGAPFAQAQQSVIDMPPGRIAYSSDGNLHDSDDWGATAFSLAMLHYAGLEDRLVHYDYNNHLGGSRKAWETYMDTVVMGSCTRFELEVSKTFNDQSRKKEAIANFKMEAEKSTAENPLWFICAGPMQMAHEQIAAVSKKKRKFIRTISHSDWNQNHSHGLTSKTWADMKTDFPEVTYIRIKDQNRSNGEDDFKSAIDNWFWLRDSDNEDWQWLYARDDTHEVDELENWKSETATDFDISDVGMTYWLITGGPNGGNVQAGWKETRALFENRSIQSFAHLPAGKTGAKTQIAPIDYIFLEAESIAHDLGEWKRVRLGDPNYVIGASGLEYLEFQGNAPEKGEPSSELRYTFTSPKNGNFRLLLMCNKRLEGAPGDQCNDAFVKLKGDYDSATDLPKSDLENYLKYFQEGSTKTPELSWQWGIRAEKGRHEFHPLIFFLKSNEPYTFSLAGRSQRFSVDYMVFYDEDKITLKEAQELFSR